MIKNERQYRITKAQAEKFATALERLTETASPQLSDGTPIHPLLQKAREDALRSQGDELKAQIADYEALRSGRNRVLASGSFGELPRALIQARIASGLSQKDLAGRLGLKEQQIQRYEANEYASANLSRVRAVIEALGVSVKEEVSLSDR